MKTSGKTPNNVERKFESPGRSTDMEAVVGRCFSTIYRLAITESCQMLYLPLFKATEQTLRMWMRV